MEDKKYWQDDYIIKSEGKFITLDETFTEVSPKPFDTIEEARESVSNYSMQLPGDYEENDGG